MKKLGIIAALLVTAGLMTGCSVKQVDQAVTKAQPVPGTGNLFRFCDGPTLIYYSNWGSTHNDEYEFIVYNGCAEGPENQNGVQNLPDQE